ncbi:hypothetical protein [Shewanella aestuarii]|uniref:Uncharacterized protein n=1 Tax=Shewanella aestuarii TaxID=1028752 RepID=A0A6G9QMT6_9GAMM|nr:hypothetical protein [Shewanella aestuarii]QIR15367.1 hypothetical protein HBH39_13420 [Shewanella aestuarii]
MKITHLVFMLTSIALALSPAATMAQPQAPEQQIISLKAACTQIAQEDSIPDNELAQFLLDCVNDQLTESGYQRIESIDGKVDSTLATEENDPL